MCVMCQVRVAGKEVDQSSYDVCHISAQRSWEVVQSSYDECHVSG